MSRRQHPPGSQSTLQVQANGVAGPKCHASTTSRPRTGLRHARTTRTAHRMFFGDGVEGATLPTGQNNIMANYRVGSGSAGNVAAGAITTLVDRPLGVSGVINPASRHRRPGSAIRR